MQDFVLDENQHIIGMFNDVFLEGYIYALRFSKTDKDKIKGISSIFEAMDLYKISFKNVMKLIDKKLMECAVMAETLWGVEAVNMQRIKRIILKKYKNDYLEAKQCKYLYYARCNECSRRNKFRISEYLHRWGLYNIRKAIIIKSS